MIRVFFFAEFIGDGGRLQLSLVRRFGRGKNVRSDRLSAVPEGHVDFRREILHDLLGSVRLRKPRILRPFETKRFVFVFISGARRRRHLFHGAGATEIERERAAAS